MKTNKNTNMIARAAMNAHNLKHNGYLAQLKKEMREKLEAEYAEKKERIFEEGKKEGYELAREKAYQKGHKKGYDKGYQKACAQLDDYFTIISNVTMLMGHVEMYKYGQERLIRAIEKQNEYIEKLNNGKETIDSLIEKLEKKGLFFKEDMLDNLLEVEERIEEGKLKLK